MLLVATKKVILIICHVNTDLINVMQLLMNPGTDLARLPLPARPNNLCVLAYSALRGELLFIAINTAPQLSYAVSC